MAERDDTESIAQDILRHLRGQRSQVAFSRRLGYRSNVAHTWETGKRMPTGSVVFSGMQRLGVDVPARILRFTRVEPAFLSEVDVHRPEGVAAFLRELRRDTPIQQVAQRTGLSRYQVSRFLTGAAEPRLPDLLRLIDGLTARLLDAVALFADPGELPSTAAAWGRLEAARSLFWRHPRAQLVLLSLDLADYRALPEHDDRWLARRLDLELYEVAADLERLSHTGQIAWSGTHWALADVQTVDTRRYPEAGLALKRWWTQQARDGMDHPDASMSYNVFTVSEVDLQRIIDLHRATFAQLRTIVAASEPGERLVLVQHHVLPLDRPSPPSTNSHTEAPDRPMVSAKPT
jgi:transcriptional regulator with XRE-family HTH domain